MQSWSSDAGISHLFVVMLITLHRPCKADSSQMLCFVLQLTMKLLCVLSLIFLLKAHVAQPAYLRQAQRQLDQDVPELNVYTDMELSTRTGSIFCIWSNGNDILDKVATGFDEAVGRTRFAGKLTLVTETGCSRLLEADDAAELETKSREFSNGQRSLWWRRLLDKFFEVLRGAVSATLTTAILLFSLRTQLNLQNRSATHMTHQMCRRC